MPDFDMRYWITTHWPRRRDQATNQPQNGIWVKNENRTVIDRVAPGDLVFLYETKSGRDILRNNADGSTTQISRNLAQKERPFHKEVLSKTDFGYALSLR